jgi:hypothetical protein
MPEPIEADQIMNASQTRWSAYNRKMADLFVQRDKCPLDSPEREIAVQDILNLWVAKG